MGLMYFVLDAKRRKVFAFLFVREAAPERVTLGKLKVGHALKGVQYLGHLLLQAQRWLWGAASVQKLLQAMTGVTSGGGGGGNGAST